jgi:hypothetical protein
MSFGPIKYESDFFEDQQKTESYATEENLTSLEKK